VDVWHISLSSFHAPFKKTRTDGTLGQTFQQTEVDEHFSELIMKGTEMWVSRYSVEEKQHYSYNETNEMH
jgi:hypothetical protein